MRLTSNAKVPKEKRSKKIVLGFAGLASAAVVGAVGFAGASPIHQPASTTVYGHNINTNVNVGTSGDNNVIHVVINYIFN